ncbi:MAG: tryptophan--tRNA ligase [Candidatus Omnitrophica bacterium]|nr:tryptophan--tRNA ligase [Candidatus Omnitrophota bacterium]
MKKKRILSGMRPTGRLHLGHLVGTLDNWVSLQQEYDCYFMVADWHALMSEYEEPSVINEYSIDNVVDWLACGIDPKKSTVFVQSEVRAHLDLFMIFSCFVPLGWLERCPTYKEQLRQVETRDLNTYGFLGYPVLQAADILAYKAEVVPVGEDQLPHLELTREIVRRFHTLYKTEVFPQPDALLTKVARLVGVDGRKMSKSYNNTINLSDTEEEIYRKVSVMITDPQRIKRTDKGHPEVCNVFSYYTIFAQDRQKQIAESCQSADIGCIDCKKMLADRIIERLKPIWIRRRQFLNQQEEIKLILKEGRQRAEAVAEKTLQEVRQAMKI